MTTADLLYSFLLPLLLLLVSAVLVLLVRPEPRDINKIPETNTPYAYVSSRYVNPIRTVGWALLLLTILWAAIIWAQRSDLKQASELATDTPKPTERAVSTVAPKDRPSVPQIVSLSYVIGASSPRVVDLGTAPIDGILIYPDSSLKLFDIYVANPETISGEKGQLEFWAENELIGNTNTIPLTPSITIFDKLAVSTAYQSESTPNAWKLQSRWNEIELVLIIYDNDSNIINTNKTIVRLNPEGKSWLFKPPVIRIISISYSVNDGPEQIANLTSNGLSVSEGDILKINSIWYKSDASSDDLTVYAYGYVSGITEKTGSSTTYRVVKDFSTPKQEIKSGIDSIYGLPWVIEVGKDNRFSIQLYRSDKVNLDSYFFSLGIPENK